MVADEPAVPFSWRSPTLEPRDWLRLKKSIIQFRSSKLYKVGHLTAEFGTENLDRWNNEKHDLAIILN
jgi:hypothetical protein